MKSNLLQYYLNWNVKCYVLIILGISCLIVYVQQEYIIVPQIHNMLAVDIKTKEWLLSKFGEYRFASFVLTPLVILLRIYLVSICFYIGNILLEDLFSCLFKGGLCIDFGSTSKLLPDSVCRNGFCCEHNAKNFFIIFF